MTHAANCGKALEPTATLDAPGAMDAAISGNHIFYIGHRFLYVDDISKPASPRLLAHYDTIELATGIDLHGNLAFVAQRMYGIEIEPGVPGYGEGRCLEVWSVADPEKPVFASRVKFPLH